MALRRLVAVTVAAVLAAAHLAPGAAALEVVLRPGDPRCTGGVETVDEGLPAWDLGGPLLPNTPVCDASDAFPLIRSGSFSIHTSFRIRSFDAGFFPIFDNDANLRVEIGTFFIVFGIGPPGFLHGPFDFNNTLRNDLAITCVNKTCEFFGNGRRFRQNATLEGVLNEEAPFISVGAGISGDDEFADGFVHEIRFSDDLSEPGLPTARPTTSPTSSPTTGPPTLPPTPQPSLLPSTRPSPLVVAPSQTTPSSQPPSSVPGGSSSSNSDSSGISRSSLGALTGVFTAIFILILALLYIRRRDRFKNAEEFDDNLSVLTPPPAGMVALARPVGGWNTGGGGGSVAPPPPPEGKAKVFLNPAMPEPIASPKPTMRQRISAALFAPTLPRRKPKGAAPPTLPRRKGEAPTAIPVAAADPMPALGGPKPSGMPALGGTAKAKPSAMPPLGGPKPSAMPALGGPKKPSAMPALGGPAGSTPPTLPRRPRGQGPPPAPASEAPTLPRRPVGRPPPVSI